MNTSDHKLIPDLARKYAYQISGGDNDHTFTRQSIIGAYIIGAEATLKRILLIIQASSKVDGGLSSSQSQRLMALINATEGSDSTAYHTHLMQILVCDIIDKILQSKHGNTDPCMAHINEIQDRLHHLLDETLSRLCRDSTLSESCNINKKPMYSFKSLRQ